MASLAVVPELKSTSSIVVAHKLSCSAACGSFPDQGLNPRLLHWQVDSLPLSHLGSPHSIIFAWRIPWIEQPGGLPSMASQRVRQDSGPPVAATPAHQQSPAEVMEPMSPPADSLWARTPVPPVVLLQLPREGAPASWLHSLLSPYYQILFPFSLL